MSARMKERLREALADYGLWVGGNLATHQDIFALFWARAAERYLKSDGRIAFVLPYAVLNAPVFAALRAGAMKRVEVRITGGWALEKVWPIFGAKSGASTTSTCVLFGEAGRSGTLPGSIDRWAGRLPRRDSNEREATERLSYGVTSWPRARPLIAESPYRRRFHQGAILIPRRFFIVEPEASGRLGARRDAPRVRGRVRGLDKAPWNGVDPPAGPIERQFLRPVVLGESILPFRMLEAVTGVIPLEDDIILNSGEAMVRGHRHLGAWLRDIEQKWQSNCNKNEDGTPRLSLAEQLNYMSKLTSQPISSDTRVVYTKSGKRLSAAIVTNPATVVDHKAYWSIASSYNEALYLCAILNSDAVLERIFDLQPRGEFNPRDFDNVVWTLAIPEYDPAEALHQDLAAASSHAEHVAAKSEISDEYFVTKRKIVRDALGADGIAKEIESLVDALLTA